MAEGLFGLGLSATLVLLYGSSNVLAMIIVTIRSAWEEIQARAKREKQGQSVFGGNEKSGKSKYDVGVQYLPRGTIQLQQDEVPSPKLVSKLTEENIFNFNEQTGDKNDNGNVTIEASNIDYNENRGAVGVSSARSTNYYDTLNFDNISPREHHLSVLSMSTDGGQTSTIKKTPTHIKQTKTGLQFGKFEKKDPILDDPHRSFLNKWFWRTWRYRAIVLPFMIHVWDTATDLGVLIQWYFEADYNNPDLFSSIIDDRKEITVLGLAIFSTCAMLVYRFISALTIYKVSNGNMTETFLQILDFKILRDLSNLSSSNSAPDHDTNHTIDTLRWVHKMEALLESGPQALLQIVFVMKEEKLQGKLNSGDYIIFASLFFSLCTLATRLINDDRYIFIPIANKMWFPPSKEFLMRAFFRLFEVTARVFSVAFVWVIFGSGIVFGWYIFQAFILLLLFRAGYLGLEIWNVFGYILATPDLALKELPNNATWIEKIFLYILGIFGCWWIGACMYITDKIESKWNIGYMFIIARSFENFIILFTVFMVSTFDDDDNDDNSNDSIIPCIHCVPYGVRHNLVYGSSLGFFILAILSTIMGCLLYYKMRQLSLINDHSMLIRSGNPLELLSAKRYGQFKKFLAGDGKNIDESTGKIKISSQLDEHLIISCAMYSSQTGDEKALDIMGDMEFNFDTKDQFGNTCLIYAARHNHLQCIQILNKYDASYEISDKKGKTAAIHAAEVGNSNCLRALGQLGADLEAKDENGQTVGEYAFGNGHMDCITVLTQFGIDWAGNANGNLGVNTKNTKMEVKDESHEDENNNESAQGSTNLDNADNIQNNPLATGHNKHDKETIRPPPQMQHVASTSHTNDNKDDNGHGDIELFSASPNDATNGSDNRKDSEIGKQASSFAFKDHNVSPMKNGTQGNESDDGGAASAAGRNDTFPNIEQEHRDILDVL